VIRAFVAVKATPDFTAKVAEVRARLEKRLAGIRWVEPENFHLTLKFLGDIAESRIEPIVTALSRVTRATPRFTMTGRGLGVFPDFRRPRVLWMGLEGEALGRLAGEVEKVCEELGFHPEPREFSPHLTIGRWRGLVRGQAGLNQEVARWKDYSFGEWRVTEMTLFQSRLGSGGARYTALAILPLGNGAMTNMDKEEQDGRQS
jgi:2'-5' RNA ligase